MRKHSDRGAWTIIRQGCTQAAIVVLGLTAIIGSGGGGSLGFPDTSCLNDLSCPGDHGTMPPLAYVDLGPGRVATQVGGTVVFSTRTSVVEPSYRWCRLPAGGNLCAEISGAIEATYTLAGANLTDDGATFRVTVTGTNGTALASSRVAVSSMPAVNYGDGEFVDADWAVASVAVPAVGGPTVSASRAAAGGNPGAFRTSAYTLPVTPSSIRVYYSALSALYDPAAQGAIYVIDFTEDCISGSSSGLLSFTLPMLEQAGHRFVAPKAAMGCAATTWTAVRRSSLEAKDFELVDGVACAAGESCPDFSAGGAQLRLGLAGGAELNGGLVPPAQSSHGFDNWKVTVWRR